MTAKQLYARLRKATGKQLYSWLRDAVALAGWGSVIWGVSQWSTPAAWITAGLALIGFSTMASFAARRQQRKKGTD